MLLDDLLTVIRVLVVDADDPVVNERCPLGQAAVEVVGLVLDEHVEQQRSRLIIDLCHAHS